MQLRDWEITRIEAWSIVALTPQPESSGNKMRDEAGEAGLSNDSFNQREPRFRDKRTLEWRIVTTHVGRQPT